MQIRSVEEYIEAQHLFHTLLKLYYKQQPGYNKEFGPEVDELRAALAEYEKRRAYMPMPWTIYF